MRNFMRSCLQESQGAVLVPAQRERERERESVVDKGKRGDGSMHGMAQIGRVVAWDCLGCRKSFGR